MNTWNYVAKKLDKRNLEYVLYFRLFRVSTFDDSLAHSWHFLSQFHEAVSLNGFPTKEFPELLNTCWLLCLHSTI